MRPLRLRAGLIQVKALGLRKLARSVIAVVVCTAATALYAVADGALVFFPDQPGYELPTKAPSSNPDVSAPAKLAPRPLLTAVVTAPRQTTDLAPSKPRAVITGGTSREEVAGKTANGSGAGQATAEIGGMTTGGANEIRTQLGLGSSGRDVIDLQTRVAHSKTICFQGQAMRVVLPSRAAPSGTG